jgi:diguanylate cyclase (GGDEF)-like protein
MDQAIIDRVKACPNLPTLPAIAMQVINLAAKEEVDLNEIASTITKDPALAGKILKTVNSSFYGRSHTVSTVSHALVIMGLQSVKTLVLGFSLCANLRADKSSGFDHMTYWRSSIYAATAAKLIAEKTRTVQLEEAFLAGLLENIGMLVLDKVMGEEYGAIVASASHHHMLPEIETARLGINHAEAGGILAEMWNLPPVLATPIAFHHDTAKVTDQTLSRLTQLIHTAGRCADVFCYDAAAESILAARKQLMDCCGFDEASADAFLQELGSKTRDVANLFDIKLGKTIDYNAILKQANEALVELTLRSQQQASQLQEKNRELLVKATTDRLTGLANRATFDEFLAEKFNASKLSGKALTLILLDLDKFKMVNDTHGHPAGDAVLKSVGQLLQTCVRQQDLACRFGGEEMAIILPDTPKAVAVAVAETLRRAIQSRQISHEGIKLPITASIGVATFEPGIPFTSPAHLVKAADLAVYKAKHSGRNNVKIFSMPTAQPKAA